MMQQTKYIIISNISLQKPSEQWQCLFINPQNKCLALRPYFNSNEVKVITLITLNELTLQRTY